MDFITIDITGVILFRWVIMLQVIKITEKLDIYILCDDHPYMLININKLQC